MALSDFDIDRAAHLVIAKHGKNAEHLARVRANQLGESGDCETRNAWLDIADAIAQKQQLAAEADQPVS